jgi:uncharacterized protein (DUF3820 family)
MDEQYERMKKLAAIRMDFGKYKDQLSWGDMVDCDPDYAQWLITWSTYKPLVEYLEHRLIQCPGEYAIS